MITRETIEEIRSRMDIVDVVSDFVTLKKSGTSYKALSPFTNEKTASFYVVPRKGIFKDFSSGKGGDAVSFVMEHEGLSYPEALKYLAGKYGIEIKYEHRQSDSEDPSVGHRESIHIALTYGMNFFKQMLHAVNPDSAQATAHLNERGYQEAIIIKFELGYAPDRWDGLLQEATSSGISREALELAGLVISKEEGNRVYDRFRGRLIFPIHGLAGKPLAFGARVLSKEKQVDQPKYINSPETDIYRKGAVLYGLYFAKNAIRQSDNVFLVEGYTDVISMHQAGTENVVASAGTALTEDQVKLIKRFTDNITVLFDGDSAGVRAAIKGIDLILKNDMNVRVVQLPENEDPDSFVRKVNHQQFKDYVLKNTTDFVSFKANLYVKRTDGDPIQKAEAIRETINTISFVPDPIKRAVYIQETSTILKVSEQVLIGELNKLLLKSRKEMESNRDTIGSMLTPDILKDPGKSDPGAAEDKVYLQERETIRLLLNYSDSKISPDQSVTDFFLNELDDVEFTNQHYRDIYQTFKLNLSNGVLLNSQYFLLNGSDPIKQVVTDLLTQRFSTSANWNDKYQISIPEESNILSELTLTNVLRLKLRVVQKMLDDNFNKVKESEQNGNLEALDLALGTQQDLKEAERQLAGKLGIVIS